MDEPVDGPNRLLVEDADVSARLVEDVLAERAGLEPSEGVGGLDEARDRVEEEADDVGGLAPLLPDSRGLDTLDTGIETNPHAPVVVRPGTGDRPRAPDTIPRAIQGTTVAQDEAASVVHGGPARAIELGVVDHVLPVDEIGPFLIQATEGSR